MHENKLWPRIAQALRTRYVRALEDDLTRERAEAARQREEIITLRAENRALVNSLLGTAGVPPIDPQSPAQQLPTGPATRRRSWPQIAITREREATRQAALRAQHTLPQRPQ